MHIKEFRERKMALIVRRCLRKSAHAAVAVALFTAVFAAAPQFSSCASDKAVETVYLGTPGSCLVGDRHHRKVVLRLESP